MKRPGIRRSRVRTPQLALAELHEFMPLPSKKTGPLAKKLSDKFRSWFFARVRSRCARWIKAGL